jgi:hypothetical protein
MTIARDGLLFKTAYFFTRPSHRPAQVNLCPFFWRTVVMLLFRLPAWAFIWLPIAFVGGFFFAVRPKLAFLGEYGDGWLDEVSDLFVPYKRWWPVLGNERITPIMPTILAGFCIALYLTLKLIAWFLFFTYEGKIITVVSLSGTGIWLTCLLLIKLRKTRLTEQTRFEVAVAEMAAVAKEFAKAKHSKLCPIIEVK